MEKGLVSADINTLTAEISILKEQTAQNIIEIGKRLIAAKGILPHGEWGKWLSEKVDFTDRTAQKFMKIAEEFGKTNTYSHLPTSKLYALLAVPQDQRDEFVKSNPVDEMTTRKLQQAIKEHENVSKEKEQLEAKLKDAEKKAQQNDYHYKTVSESYRRLEETNKGHYQKAEELRIELEKTKKQLSEAQAAGDSQKVKDLKKSLEKTDAELDASYRKIEDLERKLKERPIEVSATTVVEKIPDDVQKELEELRKKQPSEAMLKYRVHFDTLVAGFKSLLAALAEIKETGSAEDYEKYRSAVSGLIGKMSERL